MAGRSPAESFTAYLEAKQRLKWSEEGARSTTAGGAAATTPLSLLFKLADAPMAEVKLAELQTASGMPFAAFAEAIKSLGTLGYVTVTGLPGSEIVSLTELGREVSRLARPAVAST